MAKEQTTDELPPEYNKVVADESAVPLLAEEKKEEFPEEQEKEGAAAAVVDAPKAHAPPEYQLVEGQAELTNDYSTGLFECHKSPSTCLSATFVPCCSFGAINATISVSAETYPEPPQEEASWVRKLVHSIPYSILLVSSPALCLSSLGLWQRVLIRKYYGLESNLGRDCLSHFCCHTCALAQDQREVQIREDRKKQAYSLSQQANESLV
jgi:Cys-rich protein (TIGR01571 family)